MPSGLQESIFRKNYWTINSLHCRATLRSNYAKAKYVLYREFCHIKKNDSDFGAFAMKMSKIWFETLTQLPRNRLYSDFGRFCSFISPRICNWTLFSIILYKNKCIKFEVVLRRVNEFWHFPHLSNPAKWSPLYPISFNLS